MNNKPLSSMSILVVEDGVCIAFALESFLLEAGAVKVEIATTLADAETLVENSSFDAAVLDIRLPDGETYDLASALQRVGTPVIIYSGHVDEEHLKNLSPVIVCAKPAMPNEIVQCILDADVVKPRGEPDSAQKAAVGL